LGSVTALFMQFHSFKKQLESSVDSRTGQWRPVVQRINGCGYFVYDKGQRFWDASQDSLKPDGSAYLELFFRDEPNGGSKQRRPFALTRLGDEAFEYSVTLPLSHMTWFLEMLKDCEAEGTLLTSHAVTDDEEKEVRGVRRLMPAGQFLMRPDVQRIQQNWA